MDLDIPERRAFWDNQETNEQHFGVLAFDPGQKESVCYVDGDIKEWDGANPIYEETGTKLYIKSDEAYVYFMIKSNSLDFTKDKLIIPIDTIQNQGNLSYNGVTFNKASDFLIYINGKDDSHILVDPYYDSFQYLYSTKQKLLTADKEYNIKNSGKFTPMYLSINRGLYLPQDNVKVPFTKYETGKLQYGNGNPKNSDYNSLADFCSKDNAVEIRIPWQLLNCMDPSTKMFMNDLHIDGIKPVKIQEIYAGARILNDTTSTKTIEMGKFSWEPWETPSYHERLKPSYYILKDAFKKYK